MLSDNPPLLTKRRVKVARIIARLNVGGPARQACDLHAQLPDSFQSVLITGQLAEGEGDMSFLLSSSENLYRVNSMSRSISPWSDLRAFLEIVSILRRERPDIVHTHTATARLLGKLTTRVIAISESQAEDLGQRFRVVRQEKIVLIKTGFDLFSFAQCN